MSTRLDSSHLVTAGQVPRSRAASGPDSCPAKMRHQKRSQRTEARILFRDRPLWASPTRGHAGSATTRRFRRADQPDRSGLRVALIVVSGEFAVRDMQAGTRLSNTTWFLPVMASLVSSPTAFPGDTAARPVSSVPIGGLPCAKHGITGALLLSSQDQQMPGRTCSKVQLPNLHPQIRGWQVGHRFMIHGAEQS
ncbi:hypothetical protein E4U53_007103 [Claviceps sorghi]|nr:hypothetical protein E4U53_007103 [Claviceps sorghi]